MPKKAAYEVGHPMRIQARKGSLAEKEYYLKSALPGAKFPSPKAIAPGVNPAPLSDLLFHGGRTISQIEYQNIYLASGDWKESDIVSIDAAIKRATQHRGLNNVLSQYFPGSAISCDPRASLLLAEPKPQSLDEPDVQAKLIALYDAGQIAKKGRENTVFNLVLPPKTELRLGTSTSLRGLGGYHGSVHFKRSGKPVTLYYSANVFSETLPSGREHGVVAFNRPWKNVVATLYHEICEFRTDPDVNDAIVSGDNDFLGWMSRDGEECGDQPIAANDLALVFKEILASGKRTPLQFMYSNHVHGAEGPIPSPH